jgi:CRISPR/Cas system CSM-associated protein Csm2 small subunit
MKKNIITTIYEYINSEQKLNDNFWKWFGESKIKTDSYPIILFHGSKNEFSSFDKKMLGKSTDNGMRGRGFYCTTNIKTAQSYGENIYRVYLKIENPFDMLSFNSLEEIINLLNIDSSIIQERGRDTKYHSISITTEFSGVFSDSVKELGYDGIIHGQEYVFFEPTQIKSIHNDGSWNIKDNNIYS